MNSRNNQNLKRICTVLRINDKALVEIMAEGGIDVSRSKCNGWLRGANALKKADAGSRDPSDRERRMKLMSYVEFDAFCEGLVSWRRRDND